jgi:capsule biosynthesis phosphatase
MSTIVIDLDGTLTAHRSGVPYVDMPPNDAVVSKLREYRSQGFRIAIYTARNMRTHAKSIGLINAETLPAIIQWLRAHDVPYDEIHVGKPWPDAGGFYVDDRAIRPDEFVRLSHSEILALTGAPLQ